MIPRPPVNPALKVRKGVRIITVLHPVLYSEEGFIPFRQSPLPLVLRRVGTVLDIPDISENKVEKHRFCAFYLFQWGFTGLRRGE